MSDPTRRLRSLFSGIPKRRRDPRPIMVLQACIDDSKTGEEVLVLAGYLAPFEKWEQFSNEWDALLMEDPPWPEFKMREAIRHPVRAEKFYRVIEKYVTAFVVCVVEIQALRKLCDELGLDDFHRNPYHYGLRVVTDAAYQGLPFLGINENKIEFIFDKRGEQKFIDLGWGWYEDSIPDEMRERIAAKPRFEHSAEFVPLQAAEIIAWNARKHWLKYGNIDAEIELPWERKRVIPGQKVHWDYKRMKPNLVRIRNFLELMDLLPDPPFGYGTIRITFTFSFDRGNASDQELSS